MTPARVCATVSATVGFAILFVLILATRNTATTAATTTCTTTTTTTTTTTSTSVTQEPVVYFEAKKSRNQTNPGTIHVLTFDSIPINVGGGMFLNGSFFAPVSGVRPGFSSTFVNFSFTIWGQVDVAPTKSPKNSDLGMFLAVYHGLQDATYKTVSLTRKLTAPEAQHDEKWHHIGGTFVERLSKGDRVVVAQTGITERIRFLFFESGGGALTFRGELIAVSHMN